MLYKSIEKELPWELHEPSGRGFIKLTKQISVESMTIIYKVRLRPFKREDYPRLVEFRAEKHFSLPSPDENIEYHIFKESVEKIREALRTHIDDILYMYGVNPDEFWREKAKGEGWAPIANIEYEYRKARGLSAQS